MKKTYEFVIAAALSAAILTGCGGAATPQTTIPESASTVADATQTTQTQSSQPPMTDATETSEPAETASTEETTPSNSATEPSDIPASTESDLSIRDTEVYQKIQSAEGADQVDDTVKVAFAEWICENQDTDDFLSTYDEQWSFKIYTDMKEYSLNCYSQINDQHRQKYLVLHYANEEVLLRTWDEAHYTDIPREKIEELVYGARDEIGVSDELKDEFVEFIMYSDWFAWTAIETDCKTEWYFDMGRAFTDSDEKFITLFVKMLDDDPNVTYQHYCTLYYNGTEIMDGATGGPLIEDFPDA